MRYGTKLFFCILGIIVFVFGAISSIIFEETKNIALAIVLGLAAFVDAFVFMLPLIASNGRIKIPQFNYFSANYDRRTFVDRKDIIKNIVKIINYKYVKNIRLIKIHGELGVGRRTIIGKLYSIYCCPWNKWLFVDNNDSSLIESIKITYEYKGYCSDETLYKQLGKTPKVFIVLRNETTCDNLLNDFMSKWEYYNKKNKLILITYDNNIVASKSSTYVYNVTVPSLDVKYSRKLSQKLLLKNSKFNVEDIAQGNPLIIKQLCMLSKSSTELDLLKFPLSIVDESSHQVVYELFLVYLSNGIISKQILDKYCNNTTILTLKNNSILLPYGSACYISPFVFRAILDNDKYFKELNGVYSDLCKKNLLSLDWDVVDVYLNKNSYSKLLFLQNNERYVTIKSIFINIFYKLDFEKEKDKILIFLDALLKLGDYDLFKKYYEKLDHPSPLQKVMSAEDIMFNILLAEYYHLTSDYSSSNFILNQLKTVDGVDYDKVIFMLAHNYRHMGELKKAKNEFQNLELSVQTNVFLRARTISEIFSIEYVNKVIKRESIQNLLSLSENKASWKYNIIRHLAVANILQNNFSEAKKMLEQSIIILENERLRILQDYYFELAECYRLESPIKNYSKATNYYIKATIFAEMNGDKNLELCSKIGQTLLEYNKCRNKKKTIKILKSYLSSANNLSKLIYAGVDTAIRILLGDKDNINSLFGQNLAYYANLLENNDINNLKIFVM